jgi:hypothetical protein
MSEVPSSDLVNERGFLRYTLVHRVDFADDPTDRVGDVPARENRRHGEAEIPFSAAHLLDGELPIVIRAMFEPLRGVYVSQSPLVNAHGK